ncbi:hypothetical protein N1030_12905 [Desulfovibrio mangrovi]|uniref:hypothetical protein n=1 Tax=Desulfovibrio mangrovi TaxID=2976983 RepID=UPI0022473CE3|nr:hypothetical protein [Desulfovibrio mangrovi]UZP66501.1 hypothetical protein N1030_12905 [Desulfovibrio mangrovi]
MEASSRLRIAEIGERIIAQARPSDRQRIERIARVRDAVVVEVCLLPADVEAGRAEDLVNYVLEKRA